MGKLQRGFLLTGKRMMVQNVRHIKLINHEECRKCRAREHGA